MSPHITSRQPDIMLTDAPQDYVPNSNGTEVAKYPARSYCGQYSEDSSFFYTCTQDFKVHLYDTTASPSRVVRRHADADSRRTRYHVSMATDHFTSLKPIKTIQGRHGTWTVTGSSAHAAPRCVLLKKLTWNRCQLVSRQQVDDLLVH